MQRMKALYNINMGEALQVDETLRIDPSNVGCRG